jgi:hypothetical protein
MVARGGGHRGYWCNIKTLHHLLLGTTLPVAISVSLYIVTTQICDLVVQRSFCI